jgi:hypothetical protein
MQYKYTVSLTSGYIQRYPKGSNRINAFLSPDFGNWQVDDSFTLDRRQHPISPQVVAHFIAEGGYNSEYFIKQP